MKCNRPPSPQVVAVTRVVIYSKSDDRSYENDGLRNSMTARGLDVEICHPDRFAVTIGAKPVLTYDGNIFALPDLVLSRTGSGTGSHATPILRQMEAMGVHVVNSLSAIQAA